MLFSPPEMLRLGTICEVYFFGRHCQKCDENGKSEQKTGHIGAVKSSKSVAGIGEFHYCGILPQIYVAMQPRAPSSRLYLYLLQIIVD